MPVINSDPSTFSVSSANVGGIPVDFDIPSGVYSTGQWDIDGTSSTNASVDTITFIPTLDDDNFAAKGAAGSYSESVAVSAAMLGNINAASGGSLTVYVFTDDAGNAIDNFTLTLDGSMGTVVVSGNATQLQKFFDPKAAKLKQSYACLGYGAPGEVNTLASQSQLEMAIILGDGTEQHPGIGNAAWEAAFAPYLRSRALGNRWDTLFAQMYRPDMALLDNFLLTNLPSTWQFIVPGGLIHPIDAWLTRINGAYGAPITPGSAGALTAGNETNGGLPTSLAGNAPYIVHTLVGAKDYYESPPSPEATQEALVGAENSYSYQISGTVPTGVTKVRIYRSLFGDASGGPYYYDQEIAVTPTAAYPAILVTQPDALLRRDIQPPAWLSCLIPPEAAMIYALAFATLGRSTGNQQRPMLLSANGMLSPWNVGLGPSNGFLGLGNPESSAQFGERDFAGGYTQGGIRTSNYAAANLQGFAGGLGLRARIVSALNSGETIAPTYSFYDAAHGWGNVQSATATGVAFPATTVGSYIDFDIPAGRLVIAVTTDAETGTASAGKYIYEAPQVRSTY